MSPSSSPSDDPFAFLVARGPVAGLTTAAAWVAAMAEVEAALAAAQAEVGEIPAEAAATVATLAASLDDDDVVTITERAEHGGNLVIPLVDLLRERAGIHATHVHRGATSQDIHDTAAMLAARRCLAAIDVSLVEARASLDPLADAAATTTIGRTLLQWAEPTTFGTAVARWDGALAGAREAVTSTSLPLQLGGPVGDGASFGAQLAAIAVAMADRLGLVAPPRPWPTQRGTVVSLSGVLATVTTAVGSIATDIVHLTASDIGELRERSPGAGGSSSMTHKRNPIAAVCARAAAAQAPGLVATLLSAAGGHELERAAGLWHAEWPALNQLLRCAGSAAEWLATSLRRLTPDIARMAANLAASEQARR